MIKVAKRILNSDKICRSYSDLNFGVTFLEHSVYATKSSSFSATELQIYKVFGAVSRIFNV